MSTTLSKLPGYFLGNQVPWSFRILVLLLFFLVGGGLFLDNLAANVSYPDVFDSSERSVDPKTGIETRVDKKGLDTDDRKLILEWAAEKTRRLNESAKLLYDFAKITLGALIASLTQLISAGLREQYGELPPKDTSGDDEIT